MLILLYFFNWNWFYAKSASVLPSVSCKAPSSNRGRGQYDCTIITDTDTNPITCETSPPQSCTAVRTSHGQKNIQGKNVNVLEFQLTLTISSWTSTPVQFNLKDKSSALITTQSQITYAFLETEKPKLRCHDAKSTSDLFEYKTTCEADFIASAKQLTITDKSGCDQDVTYSDEVQKNQYIFSKIVKITFKQTVKKCNTKCVVKFSIPDVGDSSNPSTTKRYDFSFSCEVPKINVVGHDEVKREMTFIVDAIYEYNKIEVEAKDPATVTLDPLAFDFADAGARKSVKVVGYTVTNPSSSSRSFKISFKIYQNPNHLAHTVEKTFSYSLLIDENESIQCEPKNPQPTPKSAATVYECSIKARLAQVTFEVEKVGTELGTFTISPNNPQTMVGNNNLKTKNIDVTVTSTDVLCNQKRQVTIKIQGKTNVKTIVSHVTECPDPTITCSQQDLEKREIQCSIQINHDFVSLNILTSSQVVEISPASILIANLEKGSTHQKTFEYKLKDLRKATNNHFNMIFKVIQKGQHIAFEKSLGFEYVLKREEMPHISCDSISNQNGLHYSSNSYRCAMVTSMWNVTLKLRQQQDFSVSPQSVTGNSIHKIYKHPGFDVSITPKIIKCNEIKDVTIVFTDDSSIDHEFKMKHKTSCPDPIINCDAHDEVQRSINCKIKIEFPFHSVEIAITGNAQKIDTSDILYTDYSKVTDYTQLIRYDVPNRAQENHEFQVEFKVYQDSAKTEQAFSTFRRFEYVLNQDEIPGLVCNEKERATEQALDENKYTCIIISKVKPDSLNLQESTLFEVTATIPDGSNPMKGIVIIKNLDVTIKAKTFKCDAKSQVTLNFMDSTTKHSYIVTHKTQCPDSVVYCKSHDLVLKTITCSFDIKYKFDSIVATFIQTHIKFTSNEATKQISPTAETFTRDENIIYEINDYKITNHDFQLIIVVNQPDSTKSFERTFPFKYVLSREESPHISCNLKIPAQDQKFEESKYQCIIVSVMRNPKIKVESSEYSIEKTNNDEVNHKNLRKQNGAEFKIKPNRIICQRTSQLVIYFQDEDENLHKDIITHSTNCPLPTIVEQTQTDNIRKLTLKIEAPYEFSFKEFKSSVSTVQIISTPGPITVSGDKWIGSVEVTYKPLDWSFDDHSFAVISIITAVENTDMPIMTKSFEFKRIQEEKPSIICQSNNDQSELHPTEIYIYIYICSILSRKSTILLSVAESAYLITEQRGTYSKKNNVYFWTDYRVKIQDAQMKCNVNVKLSLSFTEYDETFTTTVPYRTTCPGPKISHIKDDISRNVRVQVDSEFPHTELVVTSVGEIKLSNIIHSTITPKDGKWHSTHVIPYELTNLKSTNHKFTLTLKVFQDERNIYVETLTLSYVLKENELPQIKCQKDAKTTTSSSSFDTSIYYCYIVSSQPTIQLTSDPSFYKIDYKIGQATDFLGLYKWNNVKVTLKDEKILCNKTSDISIKIVDAGADADEYASVVQHTTYCDQIDGNCEIQYKEFSIIHCNFTSIFAFKLNEFSCSEFINCTKSQDLNVLTSKYQEYVFDVKPLIGGTLFDFDLNITLGYSESSNVSFTYRMEYSVQTDAAVEEKVASVSAASTGMFSSFFVFLPGCLLAVAFVYALTKPKSIIKK